MISADTVQTHVRNLLGKLGVGSRLEAVTLALRMGIGTPDDDTPVPCAATGRTADRSGQIVVHLHR